MIKSGFFKAGVILLLCFALIAISSPDQTPFRFVVIGDFGCGCKAQKEVALRMLEWHQKKPFKTVITTGDNIYPAWDYLGGNRKLFVERFDKYYKPLLDRGVQFYAALGNHDAETADGIHEILDKHRFHILGAYGYYSFDGDKKVDENPLISFFALNSVRFINRPADPEQSAWLSRALTESKAVWKVVYFHHPVYTPQSSHRSDLLLRQSIEKILIAGGVQIVFQGHNHFYARSKPQSGITYVTTGGGGKDLYNPVMDGQIARAVKSYHFVSVEVTEERLSYTAISAAGMPIDQGIILKSE